VPRELVEAYAWFSVAGVGGDKMAIDNCDNLKESLIRIQPVLGKRWATELFEKYGSGKQPRSLVQLGFWQTTQME
jgi:hypothetical protein